MSRFLPKLARDKGSLDAAKATLLAATELFQNLDADAMAEVTGMVPPSPAPLTPSGFSGVGLSMWTMS